MIESIFLRDNNSHNNPKPFPASRGFTLIELMIVVAIIAIIVSMALPVYSNYTIRAKIAEALSVANAAKTAVSTTCQEDPTIVALTPAKAGYQFLTATKYVASVNMSGTCILPVIIIVTHQTGADPSPTLTISGELKQGHMDFVCVSNGLNRHLPKICRS